MTYRELVVELGFREDRVYGDGVTRLVRPVSDRVELVTFVTREGWAPLGVQVWIDGLPQELHERRAA